MINHEHKFIFIHIPKCAGISIGRTLYELIGKDPKTYEGFHIHHDEFDEKIWKEYFVFTFTRDSHDRLQSQYRYRDFLFQYDFEYASRNMKDLYEEHFNCKIGEDYEIEEQTIKEISDYYGEFIHIPSQQDFLKGKYSNQVDKRPYIDFYGKCETLQQDFDYVCEKIGFPKTKLPHTNKSANPKLNVRKIDYEY